MAIRGKSILLDPGHGGKFPGATHGSRKEKDVVLAFAKILRDKLKTKGMTVYMSRGTDKDFGGTDANDDINKRVKYINANYPTVNALLSIHVNSAIGKYGPFYQKGNNTSKAFAQAIATRYGTAPHEGDFAIIRDTTRTSVESLLELGQIDQSWLDNTASLDSTADFVVKGIEDYFA